MSIFLHESCFIKCGVREAAAEDGCSVSGKVGKNEKAEKRMSFEVQHGAKNFFPLQLVNA